MLLIQATNSTSKTEHPDNTGGAPARAQPGDAANGTRGYTEPPPSYESIPPEPPRRATADMPPNAWARRDSGPPAQRPTNMVSTSKLSGSIKGSWVVDPAILIPAPLLPDLCPGEREADRKNLHLKTNNGAIYADITLVPRPFVKDGRPRVTLSAATLNGAVKVTLREAWPDDNPTPNRLPFKLSADSMNGAISVSIPRSFRGVVVGATFNGSIKLSNEVNAQVLYEKTEGRARRIFIGEFDQNDFGEGNQWLGDEIHADTKSGNVKIRYEDEGESAPDEGENNKARSQGILSKLFGIIF